MLVEPRIIHRAEQSYVAICERVRMGDFGPIIERHSEVFGWLAEERISPVGAPFFRYLLIDMAGLLEIEAGVPVGAGELPELQPVGELLFGVLPAGRYVVATHVGHPDELVGATGELLAWATDRHLRWDMTPSPAGERWAARLENYLTDPAVEPDMTKWRTELAFRLAD